MRRDVAARLAATLLLSLRVPVAASAQERAGFWFSAAIAAESKGGSVPSEPFERGEGLDIPLAAGWTLHPGLLAGVELGGYALTLYEPDRNVEMYDFDLVAALTYYPRPSSGFFLKGGAGPSFLDNSEASAPDVSGVGFALMGGAGYDFYLGRNFSLTSAVTFVYGDLGEVKVDSVARFRDLRLNTIAASLGIKLN